MTTAEKEVPADPTLEQAVEQAAAEKAPSTPQEAPAPTYLTKEELEQNLGAIEDRVSRRWQAINDKQVKQVRDAAEERIRKLERQLEETRREQEERYLQSLPEEERTRAQAEIAYKASRPKSEPAPQPQQQPEADPIALAVQEAARFIISDEQYQDPKVWAGLNTSLSITENLDLLRRNAAALAKPKPTNNQQPAVKPQARAPQSVPVKPSPAAANSSMTDEEIEANFIEHPADPKAQQAYTAMRRRWAQGG